MLVRLTIVLLASIAVAGVAAAQNNAPPSRIGNVYDGTAHQPNPGAVQSGEAAAGIAPSPSATRANNNAVRQLNKQIQSNGAQSAAPAKSLACSTVPATCQ